ncbi:MAG TPA: tetratricopeptide repeat protein [Planctomycetota bacterium]|nr:tetratricopeptide repeat protein [Planctomycetota bacterium]
MADDAPSPAVLEAFERLRRGDTLGAEEAVTKFAQAVEAKHGARSAEYASAQCDLGNVLLNVGDLDGAIKAMRRACEFDDPSNKAATRSRITYLMNLGTLLHRSGGLDEAALVLRENVAARASFYGKDHAGYGFGLEPLAACLLAKGDLEEAARLAEETVENFGKNRHPRVATALVLRAETRKRLSPEQTAFEEVAKIPPEVAAALVPAVLERISLSDMPTMLLVLQELTGALAARLGAGHQAHVNAVIATSNVARACRDWRASEAALGELAKISDAAGKKERALEARLGIASAQSEDGRAEDALATYRDAAAHADAMDTAAKARVAREVGLYYSKLERRDEAERELRRSQALADESEHAELMGRTRIALGIFLQHQADLDEARRILDGGIRYLDAADPDAICARSHIEAIVENRSCGCGDMGNAMGSTLREIVLEHAPPGLLENIRVEMKDGKPNVQVQLKREPKKDEIELLNRLIRHATEEVKRRALARGYGS